MIQLEANVNPQRDVSLNVNHQRKDVNLSLNQKDVNLNQKDESLNVNN